MFTIDQIEKAQNKVKSGADFPEYIRTLKQIGVIAFETWVKDSHTKYWGEDNYTITSQPKYAALTISENVDKTKFKAYLSTHQQGNTDYHTFCAHCAETGIEKWVVCLETMTCTYYDKKENKILIESIPQ